MTNPFRSGIIKAKKRKGETEMENWIWNAENHEEDYEELMELLELLATEPAEGY